MKSEGIEGAGIQLASNVAWSNWRFVRSLFVAAVLVQLH